MRGKQVRRLLLPVRFLPGGGVWVAIETWVSNLSDISTEGLLQLHGKLDDKKRKPLSSG